MLKSGESAEAMTRKLVGMTLERGGSDNVTVVIGKLRSEEQLDDSLGPEPRAQSQ